MKVWKSLLLAFLGMALAGILVFALLILRGFRATSTPFSLETAVAQTARDLAIPRRERSKTNPVAADSGALREGREDFLARCSVCHGIDARGQTQMGQNLYPRVPDLHSDRTQNLTDGDIHYIIENGVQLTGMPAWGNPHQVSTDDSWKLVRFIRSLRPPTNEEKTLQVNASTSAHYVGSRACDKCHAQIYEHWKKTPMANVVRDPVTHPDAIIPDLSSNTAAKFTKEQVALVYGSLWKQRYFTKIGDDYFPLPAQWDIGNHVWRPYHVPKGGDWWEPFYPSDNMQRPTGPTCDGCHSVDYDIHTKQVVEWNVGCERCHGPGSEHVEHPSPGLV